MATIKLSPRMQAIADMVEGNTVADIGCDHAFVSIYLVMERNFKKAVAMDVRKGPISIAKKNVSLYGLNDKIDIRLSDGFEKLLPNETETAIIAGMGGGLIVDILKKGRIHTDGSIGLILQPQSEPERVRRYLVDLDYVITDEKMLVDDGKYYTVMKAFSGKDITCKDKEYSWAELLYGKKLIERKDAVLKKYLTEQLEKNERLIGSLKKTGTENALKKTDELKKENALINEALEKMK